jgi:hypothetical protein
MIKPVHIRIILYYCIIMSICSHKLLSHLTYTILYSFEGVGVEGTGGHAVPMMDNGVTQELSAEIVVPPVGSRGGMFISQYFALLHHQSVCSTRLCFIPHATCIQCPNYLGASSLDTTDGGV